MTLPDGNLSHRGPHEVRHCGSEGSCNAAFHAACRVAGFCHVCRLRPGHGTRPQTTRHCSFQNPGISRTMIAKSSNRPSSIRTVNSNFDASEKPE